MRRFCAFFACLGAFVAGCDLHPRILALPDSVGDFISERYPALLADPVTEPDIYNSAATDYGVYASPELYGSSTTDDYVLYASVNDYIVPPAAQENESATTVNDTTDSADYTAADDGADMTGTQPAAGDAQVPNDADVVAPDTDATESAPADNTADEDVRSSATVTPAPDSIAVPARPDDFLEIPMYGGRKEILTVIPGDTLYSIARSNGVTVEELAQMNNIKPPYDIRVGQKLYLVQQPTSVTVPAKPAAEPDAKANPAPAKPATAPAASTATATTPAAGTKPQPPAAPAKPDVATTTRVDVTEIIVAPGDTLYSISRAYSVPVNDLAVMNNLAAPFALYAGQKVRVPNLANAPVRSAATNPTPAAKPASTTTTTTTKPATTAKPATTQAPQPAKPASNTGTKATASQSKNTGTTKPATTAKPAATPATQPAKPKEKISSDPSKKLPTIASRSSSKFSWPVRGTILSGYGAKSNGLFNDGINISASRGTTVKAAENGVVAYAGNEVKGMGNLVIIQHADGWMTVYAHMDSMAVRRGAKVSVGQKVGTVGATGKVDKPQLHFEIRKGTKAYNPTQYLKK